MLGFYLPGGLNVKSKDLTPSFCPRFDPFFLPLLLLLFVASFVLREIGAISI